jgi:anionic cell wall polymer biosynthesis LytR-Cps2A-Psr (LCP) family protein
MLLLTVIIIMIITIIIVIITIIVIIITKVFKEEQKNEDDAKKKKSGRGREGGNQLCSCTEIELTSSLIRFKQQINILLIDRFKTFFLFGLGT